MKFKLYLKEGQIIPFGYGFAYYEIDYDLKVFYLFPFNHLLICLRNFWYKIRDISRETIVDKKIIELRMLRNEWRKEQGRLIKHCYNLGFKNGCTAGFMKIFSDEKYRENNWAKKTVQDVLGSNIEEKDCVLK